MNVEICRSKLKRPNENIPLFPDEKNVELLSRIISIFTPSEGLVIDPFGGPLTTSLACLQTNRSCIKMDNSSEAMKYAIGRLRIFATPSATMEHLEMYTEPEGSKDSSTNLSYRETFPGTRKASAIASEGGTTISKKRKTSDINTSNDGSKVSDFEAHEGTPTNDIDGANALLDLHACTTSRSSL